MCAFINFSKNPLYIFIYIGSNFFNFIKMFLLRLKLFIIPNSVFFGDRVHYSLVF